MSSPAAEVISIGDELLAGRIVNSNAAFISRKLKEIGIAVQRQTAIADRHEIIFETLAESLACNPLVIATGGLGPTLDDVTRRAAAELFDSSLEYNPELAANLTAQFGPIEALQDQATQPKKALILPNRLGSAPGLIFYDGRATLILLPGVPLEMEELMEKEVIPYLMRTFCLSEARLPRLLYFANLFESALDPLLRSLHAKDPLLKLGIYPRSGLLTVSLEGPQESIALAEEALRDAFMEHFYEASDGKIETAIKELCIFRKWTVSAAESCTGGALAMRLVSSPGASNYFLGGVVAYSNFLKEKLLDVPKELIQTQGAVSSEVALAMAESIQAKSGSDIGVAITGIAGPSGGTLEKPVGTVFIAVKIGAEKGVCHVLKGKGSRALIIEESVNFALGILYRLLKSR